MPPLVVLDIDPVIGRAEPDQEVQELLRNSGGANLGMDFPTGSPTPTPSWLHGSPRSCSAGRVGWPPFDGVRNG